MTEWWQRRRNKYENKCCFKSFHYFRYYSSFILELFLLLLLLFHLRVYKNHIWIPFHSGYSLSSQCRFKTIFSILHKIVFVFHFCYFFFICSERKFSPFNRTNKKLYNQSVPEGVRSIMLTCTFKLRNSKTSKWCDTFPKKH